MKILLLFLSILAASFAQAQIVSEHIFKGSDHIIRLSYVDSSEQRYIGYNKRDSIIIYKLDHSLEKVIIVPFADSSRPYPIISYVSKNLFSTDDAYEYLFLGSHITNLDYIRIYNEFGSLLFGCDECTTIRWISASYDKDEIPEIVNTSNGTKLLIRHLAEETEILSLPGKLPTSNTKLSVTDAPTIISSSSPSTSAYPNPSNGKIRVAYSLPEGVTTGELVITSTDGREVKRYRVGNMFNDILIEKSELASGAYFYKLTSERGESEARKFVITQ